MLNRKRKSFARVYKDAKENLTEAELQKVFQNSLEKTTSTWQNWGAEVARWCLHFLCKFFQKKLDKCQDDAGAQTVFEDALTNIETFFSFEGLQMQTQANKPIMEEAVKCLKKHKATLKNITALAYLTLMVDLFKSGKLVDHELTKVSLIF